MKTIVKRILNQSYKTTLVLILNVLGLFLFFLRDIVSTRIFGLNKNLDTVFLLLLIPTTLTYFLFSPLNDFLMPRYQKAINEKFDIGLYLWKINFYIFLVFGIVFLSTFSFLKLISGKDVWFFSNYLFFSDFNNLRLAMPILLFGGLIISANIYFNALGAIFLTSATSLIVPVFALSYMIIFQKTFGEMTFFYGMLYGQMLNLVIVYIYAISKTWRSIFFWKKIGFGVSLNLIPQYIFSGSSYYTLYGTNSLSTFFASIFPSGSVTLILLVNKFINFFGNLFQNVFNTVMLPYFARIQLKDHERLVQEKLFYLVSVAALGLVLILISTFGSSYFSHFLFLSSKVELSQVDNFSELLKVGTIQVPLILGVIILFKWLTLKKDFIFMFLISTLMLMLEYFLFKVFLINHAINLIFVINGVIQFLIGLIFMMRLMKLENLTVSHFKNLLIAWFLIAIPLLIKIF